MLNALCDDLNTPLALAELSALATEANKAEPQDWPRLKGLLLAAGSLLGLLQRDPDEWARGDASDADRIDGLVLLLDPEREGRPGHLRPSSRADQRYTGGAGGSCAFFTAKAATVSTIHEKFSAPTECGSASGARFSAEGPAP